MLAQHIDVGETPLVLQMEIFTVFLLMAFYSNLQTLQSWHSKETKGENISALTQGRYDDLGRVQAARRCSAVLLSCWGGGGRRDVS